MLEFIYQINTRTQTVGQTVTRFRMRISAY